MAARLKSRAPARRAPSPRASIFTQSAGALAEEATVSRGDHAVGSDHAIEALDALSHKLGVVEEVRRVSGDAGHHHEIFGNQVSIISSQTAHSCSSRAFATSNEICPTLALGAVFKDVLQLAHFHMLQ